MGNSWFQFKQFTIHQQHNAMKVTTDACLFGALLPRIEPEGEVPRMLDIGCGTGLLSLMAAQLNPHACITGVEIDAPSAKEAAGNVAASPYKERVTIIHANILHFKPEEKFHHIFSNPPFYEKQLPSPNRQKNIAHHSGELTLDLLIPLIPSWLWPNGTASLLVPYYREQETIGICREAKLFPHLILRVRQTAAHDFFRSILHLKSSKSKPHVAELTITDESGDYTPEFISLLRPFYLKL